MSTLNDLVQPNIDSSSLNLLRSKALYNPRFHLMFHLMLYSLLFGVISLNPKPYTHYITPKRCPEFWTSLSESG